MGETGPYKTIILYCNFFFLFYFLNVIHAANNESNLFFNVIKLQNNYSFFCFW